MSNKQKVYVVTDGWYSDYRIRCVCSTMEKALYAKKFYNADNDIEKYELDALPDHPNGMFWHKVQMNKNGDVSHVSVENAIWSTSGLTWAPYGDNELVIFSMWARDKTHAVKIANEHRITLIASGQWCIDLDEWCKIHRRGNHS